MTAIYTTLHEGLVLVHHALTEQLGGIAASAAVPAETLIPQVRETCGFLLGHHEMEDSTLFPGLRRVGRLRSTDVAFLAARDEDHRVIHRLTDELLATTGALHPHSATLAAQARRLREVLSAHTREEEQGLAPARMREMITADELAELLRELEERRAEVVARLGRTGT
jgi:hypothetical protein